MTTNQNSSETEPIRVLLIEDDAAQARLVEHLITRTQHTFHVEWVDRLSLAIERMREGELDVVVVDLGLPDSRGIATFDAVRAANPFLPAVVMTGTECETLAIEAVRRGAQDYIVKGQHSGPTISRAIRYAVERNRLEEQLRQSQKMEAVGALASGVAHEFNNLLQAIMGYTRFALEGLPANDIRHRDLSKALEAADQATNLTRQLLNFSRHDGPKTRETSVTELIMDVADLVTPLLGDSWKLEIELPSEVITLVADAGMLQQAFMNLCINARDSMPDGGTITVGARATYLPSATCTAFPDCKPGDYIAFSIRDTGCGIPAELRQRVTEPFFTTKEPGKGSGLGLAMVYSIAKQHGGHLHIESEEGVGSTFAVYLPLGEINTSNKGLSNSSFEVEGDGLLSLEGAAQLVSHLLSPQST
ncbi:MAG: response regulator [Planctomycetaceae bacterium]|nr:response regulator [Planctomycetales bacterium]MCB9921463.1 response regulator [Planctomycetaceae bacterium]